MRLALLSDIHGNLTALDAVLVDIEHNGPFDAIGVAGDLCEWGPQPAEVLQRLQQHPSVVIQGNTDLYLTISDTNHLRALGRSENSIESLAWTREQIGPEGVAYLAALPFGYHFAPIHAPQEVLLMVHANPQDQITHIAPDASPAEVAAILGETDAVALAFGHLHIPYIRPVNDILLIDVASVGRPRDGDLRASYAIVEYTDSWHATIQRVSFDVEATAAAFRASGIPRAEKRIRDLRRATYNR